MTKKIAISLGILEEWPSNIGIGRPSLLQGQRRIESDVLMYGGSSVYLNLGGRTYGDIPPKVTRPIGIPQNFINQLTSSCNYVCSVVNPRLVKENI